MNPLQQIPPAIRKWLYLAYALVALTLGGFQVYGTDQLGALDVSKALEVLAYIGIPFGFTAASNLPSYEDVVTGDAQVPPVERNDAGQSVLYVVLVIVGILLAILLLARTL